jgi:L-malate glycosyltransferase
MSGIPVLHIIKSLGRGGAETLLPETIKVHDRDLFEFHCIYFLPWKDQMVESIRQAGGRVSCLPASNNIVLMTKVKDVVRYVKENNIRIIHAHLPWAGFLARLVHKMTGVPVLYTEHNKQERYHGVTKFLNRATFNYQSGAIAVSADVATSITKNIRVRIPVHTILNGVNTDFFQRSPELLTIRKEHAIPEGAVVVGTVAVFRFQKRLVEWLEVFAKAAQGKSNVFGVIVGDGPLKAEILETRKKLGLEERVIMPGLQTNVKPWLAAFDVYMMTSQFEGLPIALLEAMSMECAIVSTDAGGIKEVVVNDVSGLLAPVDRHEELVPLLASLLTDSQKRKRLATAARERAVVAYGMKRMVTQLETLYRETIGG